MNSCIAAGEEAMLAVKREIDDPYITQGIAGGWSRD